MKIPEWLAIEAGYFTTEVSNMARRAEKDETLHIRLIPRIAQCLASSLKNLQHRSVFHPDENATAHDVELISVIYDAITAANLRRLRGEKP